MSVTHIPQVAIETRHLYKRFGDVTALDDINLRIAQGEFVAIMGASGSGKTTLMNILTCLDTATEGQVFLDGSDDALAGGASVVVRDGESPLHGEGKQFECVCDVN